MKIVLFHYHLKPGGVTTVIKHQVSALKDVCEVLIITGENPPEKFHPNIKVVPELAYTKKNYSNPGYLKITTKIIAAILEKWPEGCDVFHAHNPTLAKNKYTIQILKELQKKGINLFLQIHDFAEDGRPQAYSKEEYPLNCHYGVINSRDYNILLKTGLTSSGLHKIPNIITPLKVKTNNRENHLLLYPVRAIRRKNLGEAILLSLFLETKDYLGISLPASSEADMQSYSDWKEFVLKNELKVSFELGLSRNFLDIVAQAKMIITTSITEGFGFTFLEPWTADKQLFGRLLPDICQDFIEEGINLSNLYSEFSIPLELIDVKSFFKRWQSCILDRTSAFNLNLSEKKIISGFNSLTKNQKIDMGFLDEIAQKEVIGKILKNRKLLETIKFLNPYLDLLKEPNPKTKLIEENKEIIFNNYTEKQYKKRLLNIYRSVTTSQVSQKINKKQLLKEFLNPLSFKLLKWGSADA